MKPERRILGLTLREHIGGRWAISWIVYLINFPFNALAVSTSIRTQPSGSQWWLWALVAVSGPVVIGLGFLLANATYLRHRREEPVAIWVVSITGLIIGMTRGGAVVVLAASLGLQPFALGDLVNRMLAGGLIGALVLPMGAFALSCISRYRTERRRLERDRLEAERAVLQQQGELEVLREALVLGVREQLQETIGDLASRQANPREVSQAIRGVSHDVWASGDSPVSGDTRVRDVLWAAVRSQPLPVVAIAGIWAISAAGSLMAAQGVFSGLVNLGLSTIAIAACLTLANVWIRRHPRQWVLAVSLMLVLAWSIASPLSYLLFDPGPWQTAVPVIVVNLFWLPAVTFLVTVSVGALRSSEVVLDSLQQDLTETEVRSRVIAREREATLQELAAQVHGSAHSPMVVGAALAQRASDSDTHTRWLVEQIGSAVAQISLPESPASLQALVERIAEPWTGLVDVRIVVEGEEGNGLSEDARRTIDRIIEEAVANAFRHGNANTVDVSVGISAKRVVIDVRDNGDGPAVDIGEGLGTRLLDTAAESWSLSAGDDGGARLQVEIAR